LIYFFSHDRIKLRKIENYYFFSFGKSKLEFFIFVKRLKKFFEYFLKKRLILFYIFVKRDEIEGYFDKIGL